MYTILLIIYALCLFVYFILIKPCSYWESRGVPQFNVPIVWLGNIMGMLQLSPAADNIIKMYKVSPGARYSGMYEITKPMLVVKDPELIKQMTVKDFDHFMDHNSLVSEDSDPLWGKNLLTLKGDRWRDMRATLSPSFTSSRMKGMFNLISECAQNFVQHFQSDRSKVVTVELKDIFTRFTNDVIASTAFGITCDSLKERDNEFYLMGKEATNFSGFWRNLKFFIMIASPWLTKCLGLRLFNQKVSAFFRSLVTGNMEIREKNGIVRPDMIHLLMEARKGRLNHDDQETVDSGFAVVEESEVGKRRMLQLGDDDVTAQALIFFFAGFDTVSTLICFSAYELAVNPLIQQKLQEEIDDTLDKCKGTVTYEALLKMEYLDMVISETLRKWPSAITLDRISVKPYTIQPELADEEPVHIEKGTFVLIPSYAIHHDEKYFPNPDRFDPERFSSENKKSIMAYTYLPFGAGPRSCIGNRFALLETKILLFNILRHFEIVVTEKSVIPVMLSCKQISLASKDGFWFGFKSRKIFT